MAELRDLAGLQPPDVTPSQAKTRFSVPCRAGSGPRGSSRDADGLCFTNAKGAVVRPGMHCGSSSACWRGWRRAMTTWSGTAATTVSASTPITWSWAAGATTCGTNGTSRRTGWITICCDPAPCHWPAGTRKRETRGTRWGLARKNQSKTKLLRRALRCKEFSHFLSRFAAEFKASTAFVLDDEGTLSG